MLRFAFFIVSYLVCIVPISAQEHYYTLLFDSDRFELKDTAMLEVVQILYRNKIDRILIEAHCDSVGSKKYNELLSRQRATEVKRLLTDNGFPVLNIKTCVGYGKDRPLNKNESEAERQANRRAVITFYLKEPYVPKPANYSNEKPKEIVYDSLVISNFIKQEQQLDAGSLNVKELKVGQNVVLDNMYFWGGRHVLKNESIPTLEQLYRIMKENPTLEIEIEGHVCCTSFQADGFDWDTERNDLSVARAITIYTYLINHGIEKKRLSFKGYGGTKKVVLDESTEELRSLNRRVELKILKL